MLDLLCTGVKGKNSADVIFIKYMINIVKCQDTCESVCFKLGMMLDTTKLYSLIPVWMTLVFTQGHRQARTCAVILLLSCVKQLKCS